VEAPRAEAIAGLFTQKMERLEQELHALKRLINDQQHPAESLIRLWLWNRDPSFTAAEVEEHVLLVKRELAQL
jgi:hypothetical protein